MSTNSKHTPGPWSVDLRQKYLVAGGRSGVDHARVASCASYDNAAQAEANARLIAAAPELLEALERLERDISAKHAHELHGAIHPDFTMLFASVKNARAAIAKATGEGA